MQKKTAIIQTPVRITSTGGVERYVNDLSCALAARGYRITVVCAGSNHRSKSECGYSIWGLSPLFRIANTEITPLLLPAILSEPCDLIHTHIPTPWAADMSALASWITKKPLVVTYHNDIACKGAFSFIAGWYNRFFLPLVLKKAGRIIITRTHHQSAALQRFSDKLIHIPPGVDSDRFRPEECPALGDVFFLSVLDEYHQYKGLDILLDAVSHLKHRFPQLRVIVGGSGPLLESYIARSRTLGIRENIIFPGYVPEHELKDYYCGTSVFILPSTDPSREGFGLVLLEAMACGKPVITTDIAGMAEEIAEFKAGIIIPPGSAEKLAEAVRWIMEHRREAEVMGKAARTLVEQRYAWDVTTSRIERLYAEITG